MLKSLLLAGAVTALLTSAVQAQSPTTFADALRTAHWPVPGDAAAPAARTVVSQLQETVVQNASGASWVNYARDAYSQYTGMNADLPRLVRNSRWTSSGWTLMLDTRRHFSATGKLLGDTLISYQLSPQGMAYFADANRFDAADRIIEEKRFSGAFGTWDELKRNTHSYNGTSTLVAQVLEENFTGGSYSPAARRLHTYDAQGRQTELEAQTADGAGGWGKLQKATSTYSSNATGNVHQVLVQNASVDGSTYLTSNRQTLQYDAQGRAQLLTIETWQNNAWQNYSQTTYTYDVLGNPTVATMQVWNGTGYQNYQRLLLTYLQVTGTAASRALAAGLSVAPNPAAGPATVRYTLPAAGRATVQVLDLSGRRVATLLTDAPQAAGAHSLPLPTGQLAAGLYLLQLQVGNQREQTKLLLP